jgi:hypothetical protein
MALDMPNPRPSVLAIGAPASPLIIFSEMDVDGQVLLPIEVSPNDSLPFLALFLLLKLLFLNFSLFHNHSVLRESASFLFYCNGGMEQPLQHTDSTARTKILASL